MDLRKGTALITGASAGIGAVYADRLAMRGYDLVLVARNEARLKDLAIKLKAKSGVRVEVLRADLTESADLAKVEQRLSGDPSLTLLINNAGAAGGGGFKAPDIDKIEAVVAVNLGAVMRLALAAAPGFAARGTGAIINLASVLAYAPERNRGIYSATKAFAITFSKSLQLELGPMGVYVQIVAPAATATEIWDRSDMPAPDTMMSIDDVVDAALVGFDRREPITFPSLSDPAYWDALEAARLAMAENVRNTKPGARYQAPGYAI